MKDRGRIIWLLGGLTAVILVLAVACGGDDEAAPAPADPAPADPAPADPAPADPAPTDGGEPVRIAFFTAIAQNAYYSETYQAIQDVAETDGNATVEIFDANFDAQAQFNQIQDAITSGNFDAFIIAPVDAASVVPIIEEAADAGIVVAAAGAVIGDDWTTADPQVPGVVFSAAEPPIFNGEQRAQLIIEACEGIDPCKVAHIAGDLGYTLDIAALDTIEEAIADHPNIEIVASAEGGYTREPAYSAMQDILQANPDLSLVASAGDAMTAGAEQALEEAGLADQVQLAGNGATVTAVDAVREGRWVGTVVFMPYTEGELAAEAVIKAVRGEPVDVVGVIPSLDVNPAGPLLTQENASEFEAQWDG